MHLILFGHECKKIHLWAKIQIHYYFLYVIPQNKKKKPCGNPEKPSLYRLADHLYSTIFSNLASQQFCTCPANTLLALCEANGASYGVVQIPCWPRELRAILLRYTLEECDADKMATCANHKAKGASF